MLVEPVAATMRRDGAHQVRVTSTPFNISPLHTITGKAKRILKAGVALEIPAGWTIEALQDVEYKTGTYDVPHCFTLHHVTEIAKLGQALLDLHAAGLWPESVRALTTDEVSRLKWLNSFVKFPG